MVSTKKQPSAKAKGKQPEQTLNSSSSKQKQPAQTQTRTDKVQAKPKKAERSKVRRVHVSGLPPINEDEVRSRFKSFGTVTKVDGLGKMDGNGNPLRYAFIDIDITKSKLAQCMNLLSGSIWKGSTLRIADARPSFLEKLEKERKLAAKKTAADAAAAATASEGAPAAPKDTILSTASGADATSSSSKKRKREKAEGVESENMELVDKDNVKAKDGWKLDPATSTPVFPIIARPDHPLPPVPGKLSEAEKKKQAAAKAAKQQRDAKKDGKKVKKSKTDAAAVPAEPPNRARRVKIDPTQWKPKHEREQDLAEVHGSGSTKSAHQLSLQEVDDASGAASSSEDDEESERDAEAGTSSSDEGSDEGSAEGDSKVDGEQGSPDLVTAAALTGPEASNLAHADPGREEETVEEEESGNGEAGTDDNEGDEDEQDEQMDEDKAGEDDPNHDVAVVLDEDAAMGEENSEGEDDGSQDSGEKESDSEDDQDVTESRASAMSNVHMQSLTDMFKPQESAAGFSLGSLLDDFELEDLPEPTAAAPATLSFTRPISQHAAARPLDDYGNAKGTTGGRAAYDPHETLFFPFPLAEDEQPGGLLYKLPAEEKEALLDRSWTGRSAFKRFKRTQTLAEIATNHENVRKTLSEQVRKRHREAVKRRKRTGGRAGDRKFTNDNEA